MRHGPISNRIRTFLRLGVFASIGVWPGSGFGIDKEPPEQSDEKTEVVASLSDVRELLVAGDYEPAIEGFTRLLEDVRHGDKARVGLAEALTAVGRYDEAIETLSGKQTEASADARWLLARLYRITGRYDDTLAQCRAAIEIDSAHASARLVLGETLELLGRRGEAVEAYKWFDRQLVQLDELPRDARWLTDTALGFYRYSVLTQTDVARRTQHVLHDMLQPAYARVDRTYWPARIAAANLLHEKFNDAEEDGSVSDYEAALKINPNLCEAHVGLGDVALSRWDFEEAERRAELALAVNAAHAPAIHLRASTLIMERRYRQALDEIDKALSINSDDLTALSIRAAAGACLYDRAILEKARGRVAKVNPRCALLHKILGDAVGGIRQYPESEREYLVAMEYDPTDANVRTELGLMYMQWGKEDKAREALDGAWVLDPYNQKTKFTLELLDSLEGYARHETAHFIVRHDATRDPGLGEYVAAYLEEIYEDVVGDYEFPLSEKTIVEMFPTQRAFAVRITGKPWIHTVGACTGRVIAMASPRKSTDLSGPYNYASVLKHEFTHTVTLAATQNRIPHWFTEGLAVFQEDAERGFFWCQLLAEAARRDELFTLESIDWGFIRPKKPTDRQMAYAQSEWMCEYIVERFGYESFNAMLRRFREGQTPRRVFVEQLGIEPSDFDAAFAEWAKREIAGWGFESTPPEDVDELRRALQERPDDGTLIGRLARAEFDAEEWDEALKSARRALELDPKQVSALDVLANVLVRYAKQELMAPAREAYLEEAVAVLDRLWVADPKGATAPRYLAEIALSRGEPERAREPRERRQRVCPRDPASWRGLGGLHLQAGNYDAALPQLLELARIDENDVGVHAQLGRIYKAKGRLTEAQHWYRQALYVNPFDVEVHDALGEVSMRIGDTRSAFREYKMLTELEPGNGKFLEKAAFAAHKLGDTEQARALAKRAVQIAPASPARSLLP